MLEILVRESIELPAFSTLERIAINARALANRVYFHSVTEMIGEETEGLLETLLHTKTDSGITHWQLLKSEPKKPSAQGLRISLPIPLGSKSYTRNSTRYLIFPVVVNYSRTVN